MKPTGISDTSPESAGRIVLRAPDNPRTGWEEAFELMHARGDDALLDGDQLGSSSWDDEEWEWD